MCVCASPITWKRALYHSLHRERLQDVFLHVFVFLSVLVGVHVGGLNEEYKRRDWTHWITVSFKSVEKNGHEKDESNERKVERGRHDKRYEHGRERVRDRARD